MLYRAALPIKLMSLGAPHISMHVCYCLNYINSIYHRLLRGTLCYNGTHILYVNAIHALLRRIFVHVTDGMVHESHFPYFFLAAMHCDFPKKHSNKSIVKEKTWHHHRHSKSSQKVFSRVEVRDL